MEENKDFIEMIVGEIRSAAKEEVERILREARREAERIVEEARERAKAIREENIRKMLHEYRVRLRREIAPRKLEIRNRFLMERHKMLTDFFEKVSREAISILRSNEELYSRFILKSITEIIESIKTDHIIIHPCSVDQEIVAKVLPKVIEEYRSKGRVIKLEIGAPIDCRGGLVGESADGREYFNATLESKLIQIRNEIFTNILVSLES